MFESKLLINDIEIKQGRIDISIAFVCDYNPNVISPKVKINFASNGENRRMPIPVTSYFKRYGTNEGIIICTYSYYIKYLFNSSASPSDILISFELYYGNEYIEKIPFKVSKGILFKNPELEIEKKYIGGSEFDGIVEYVNQEIEDESDTSQTENVFDYRFDPEKGTITLTQNNSEDKSFSIKRFFYYFFHGLFFIINFLLCFLLLPYFIIDGILSGIGLLPKHRYREVEGIPANIISQIKANIAGFLKMSFKSTSFVLALIKPVKTFYKFYYKMLTKKPVVQNRIAFLSCRRDEMGGNEQYVYDLIKDNKDIDFQFLFFSDPNGNKKARYIRRFVKLYASSKVVIVDDYFPLLNSFDKREDVTLFQLWHACGAFKTFGFSRTGKKGGPRQNSPNHRMYDYAIVSSAEVAKHYAEGFGVSDSHIIPTGIPRTDIFMDKEYAQRVTSEFYEKHPDLKNKKIILFAPTFRGNGLLSAYYPLEVFDPQNLVDSLGSEYAVILKLHPFCKRKYEIAPEYEDRILDLSDDDELNDLLFVTDTLITDYSSVVFEASLLNIPMVFYAYDLYKYISERDFYSDYTDFVPGKIVYTQDELEASIRKKDFEIEKVEPFKNKYFNKIDGKSSQRVADEILKALKNNK